MNKSDLMVFEEDIKREFIAGKIRFPVHFSGGNEDQLIEIFEEINREDWVFCSHRNHYHALLKGIPPEWIKAEILKGNSMHLMNPEYKFFASAIVGGCIPIALGVAMAIKRDNKQGQVWCFVGDMASEAGIFHECTKYAHYQNLPIHFVIEDNGFSTNTPTYETWGGETRDHFGNVGKYKFERTMPHINVDQWVEFK